MKNFGIIFLLFILIIPNICGKTNPFVEHIIRITFLKGITGMSEEELKLYQKEYGIETILDENIKEVFIESLENFNEKSDISVLINVIKVLIKKFEETEENKVIDNSVYNTKEKSREAWDISEWLEHKLIREFYKVGINQEINIVFEEVNNENLNDEEINNVANRAKNNDKSLNKILQLISIEMACIENELKESLKDLKDLDPEATKKKLERSETLKKRLKEEKALIKLYVAKRKVELFINNGRLDNALEKLKGERL
uniref:Uncharacterized protein n=1 Tax=Meloidogyne hapla TaxID=6305 RepID=A0A1I8BPI5_MELHA